MQALNLKICFPTGEYQNLTFYVTLLDQSCMIVLVYCWLTHYNPLIDWVLASITFWQTVQHDSKSSPSIKMLPSSAPSVETLDPVPGPLNPILPVNPGKPPRIILNHTAVYTHTSKLEGLKCFKLQ